MGRIGDGEPQHLPLNMTLHRLKPPFKVLARHRSPHFLTDRSPDIVTSDVLSGVDVGLMLGYLIGIVVGKRRLLWHGVVREHVDRVPCRVLDRPCGTTCASITYDREDMGRCIRIREMLGLGSMNSDAQKRGEWG